MIFSKKLALPILLLSLLGTSAAEAKDLGKAKKMGKGNKLPTHSARAQVLFRNGLDLLEGGNSKRAAEYFRQALQEVPKEGAIWIEFDTFEPTLWWIGRNKSNRHPVPYLPTLFLLFAACEQAQEPDRKKRALKKCYCSPEKARETLRALDDQVRRAEVVGTIEKTEACPFFCKVLDCVNTCETFLEIILAQRAAP